MNTSGSICPSCAKDIGVWSIMRAPLPNIGIRCPHCKAALEYTPAEWGFIGVILLLFIPLLVVVAAATRRLLGATTLSAVAFFVVALALWLPIEFVMARRLRARSQLTLK